MKKYRFYKRAHEIPRNNKQQKYKWFHEMDDWHGNRVSVDNRNLTNATK